MRDHNRMPEPPDTAEALLAFYRSALRFRAIGGRKVGLLPGYGFAYQAKAFERLRESGLWTEARGPVKLGTAWVNGIPLPITPPGVAGDCRRAGAMDSFYDEGRHEAIQED